MGHDENRRARSEAVAKAVLLQLALDVRKRVPQAKPGDVSIAEKVVVPYVRVYGPPARRDFVRRVGVLLHRPS